MLIGLEGAAEADCKKVEKELAKYGDDKTKYIAINAPVTWAEIISMEVIDNVNKILDKR